MNQLIPIFLEEKCKILKVEKCPKHLRCKINYDLFGKMFFRREWMTQDKDKIESVIDITLRNIKKDIEYFKSNYNSQTADLEIKESRSSDFYHSGFIVASPSKEEFERFKNTGRTLYFNIKDGFFVKNT